MSMALGYSSMSCSSSLEANDIVWELVKNPFSAWATAQQNIIIYRQTPTRQRQIFRHARSGKVFKCRGIQRKNGLG
jgi:hypothetical protein